MLNFCPHLVIKDHVHVLIKGIVPVFFTAARYTPCKKQFEQFLSICIYFSHIYILFSFILIFGWIYGGTELTLWHIWFKAEQGVKQGDNLSVAILHIRCISFKYWLLYILSRDKIYNSQLLRNIFLNVSVRYHRMNMIDDNVHYFSNAHMQHCIRGSLKVNH